MEHGDGFGVSYEGTHQLMYAQGAFRPRATTTQWGIDFIAANLKTPVTTLHYPSMSQFIKEIKKGYDYVGIAFISATLHKMVKMIQAVRKHAPATQIILGGYGTALAGQIDQYADHVCRGEGVAFMRELLGERVDAPIVQPDISQDQTLFSIPLPGTTGYIFAGLGCPNGCDFCATSHYFKRKHIAFLPDGKSIVAAIERMREKHPGMYKFWINDEDFLLNQRRGRGFLEAIRKTDLPPLSISVFSSVKALSQYEPQELVEMGIDWVWVGYEGHRAGYSKQQGKPYEELFPELKRHGISVMASMIIGFDYQTPQIIQEEFEQLMSLRPSMNQFLIYGPAPGTPLMERLEEEGRLDPEVSADNSKHDGFTLGFKHPHIGRAQMSDIQRELAHYEFSRLGPAVFRIVEDYIEGYEFLKDHQSPRVQAKGLMQGQAANNALPLLSASKSLLSPERARDIDALINRIEQSTGPMSLKQRLLAKFAVPLMIRYTQFKLDYNIGEQPEFSRRSFGKAGPTITDAIKKWDSTERLIPVKEDSAC